MAKTIRLGLAFVVAMIGPIIPAVVRPATVADPSDILIRVAMKNPNNNGFMSELASKLAISLLTPLAMNICFKAPAPATINSIIAMSFTALP